MLRFIMQSIKLTSVSRDGSIAHRGSRILLLRGPVSVPNVPENVIGNLNIEYFRRNAPFQ